MNAIDRIIQYYAEGSINELVLLTYCENIGMTDASIDKVLKRAEHSRNRHLARLERDQQAQDQSNQEAAP